MAEPNLILNMLFLLRLEYANDLIQIYFYTNMIYTNTNIYLIQMMMLSIQLLQTNLLTSLTIKSINTKKFLPNLYFRVILTPKYPHSSFRFNLVTILWIYWWVCKFLFYIAS